MFLTFEIIYYIKVTMLHAFYNEHKLRNLRVDKINPIFLNLLWHLIGTLRVTIERSILAIQYNCEVLVLIISTKNYKYFTLKFERFLSALTVLFTNLLGTEIHSSKKNISCKFF